ncbi:large subunit ribosomal protein L10Ae [Nematocida homosporus]|uniref:large subunit ribosomal protein L10Ae n=1 Tax=Nematocida homosporus TaxID=1912981 RepID=UPI00221FBA65|nr:large subunit ribosomal protein L10Ae [Nematocida homosporus]KAI5184353.1 large subunit ribosomal protein L10Ae [Nematocida homosporus]
MSSKIFGADDVIPVIRKITEGVREKKKETGETIELRIGFKGYDAKEQRLRGEVTLPFPKRRTEKVLVIADNALARVLEGTDIPFVMMENYKGETKEMKKMKKKLVKSYHAFISVASVYKVIKANVFSGKKKPVFMIKNINDIRNFYEDVKRKVQLNLKADLLLGFSIGTTTMPVEEVAQNFSTAMSAILGFAKKGMQNIKSVHVKSTQGKPIKYY